MEEKEKHEPISKEMVEKVINSLTKAVAAVPVQEDSNFDLNKVKEVINSLEGCTADTVICILSSAFLLLPAEAIKTVIDMGKRTFVGKALKEIMDIAKTECPDCECSEDTKTSETPKE